MAPNLIQIAYFYVNIPAQYIVQGLIIIGKLFYFTRQKQSAIVENYVENVKNRDIKSGKLGGKC